MKYKLFLVFNLLLLLPVLTLACPWFRFSPRDYRMFRAPEYASPRNVNYGYNYEAEANCRLWREQIADGSKVSIEDIYNVVYKTTLSDLKALASGKSEMPDTSRFAAILLKDNEALDFLLLAKNCEELRQEMSSPWYYPAPDDREHLSLEKIVQKAKDYTGRRFKSRYVLQAERALLSLHRYDDCINYWNEVSDDLPDDVLYRMAMRYVAGAFFNIGDALKARELYALSGDVDNLSIYEIYEFNPDSPSLRRDIARVIESAEREREENGLTDSDAREPYTNYVDYTGKGKVSITTAEDLAEWRLFCRKAASGGRVSDPAFWYYAAAYIEHLLDDNAAASRTLAKAENKEGSRDVKESIRVFRIYLDSMLIPFSKEYVPKMVENLRWLDKKIVSDTAAFVKNDYIKWEIETNRSVNYWNDMMRKIVLTGIVPKLLDNGAVPYGFIFADIADTRLLSLLGKDSEYEWSSATFKLLDSVDVNYLIRYVELQERPRTASDIFLVSRCTKDVAYLCDIIGTRLLREMRYGEAEKWLSKVPASFSFKLNTYGSCMFRDPFSLTLKRAEYDGADFKYSFAKEMASLEREIASTEDYDRKALMLLKMATGMKSSVTQCWGLTFYEKHWYDIDPNSPPTDYSKAMDKILKRADELFAQAKKDARDPEVKACINLALGNQRTVMEHYELTSAAESIQGKCDTYYDYHLDKDPQAGFGRRVTNR